MDRRVFWLVWFSCACNTHHFIMLQTEHTLTHSLSLSHTHTLSLWHSLTRMHTRLPLSLPPQGSDQHPRRRKETITIRPSRRALRIEEKNNWQDSWSRPWRREERWYWQYGPAGKHVHLPLDDSHFLTSQPISVLHVTANPIPLPILIPISTLIPTFIFISHLYSYVLGQDQPSWAVTRAGDPLQGCPLPAHGSGSERAWEAVSSTQKTARSH